MKSPVKTILKAVTPGRNQQQDEDQVRPEVNV
jgi:hypothetical protein